MRFVLDTNILVLIIKSEKFSTYFRNTFLQNTENQFSICFVSLGELDSIALQNQWGETKLKVMRELLRKIEIIPLNNKAYSQSYALIDSYSQGRLKEKPLPQGLSARNMGKNDLWIAAIAHTFQARLMTTDKDFEHLQGSFLDIQYIDIQDFM